MQLNFFNKLGIILNLLFLAIPFPTQSGFAFDLEKPITFLPPGTEFIFIKETIISKFEEKEIGKLCEVRSNSDQHIVKIKKGSKFILKNLDASKPMFNPFDLHLMSGEITLVLTKAKSPKKSAITLRLSIDADFPSVNEVFAKCPHTSEIPLECQKWCGSNIAVEKIPPIPEM